VALVDPRLPRAAPDSIGCPVSLQLAGTDGHDLAAGRLFLAAQQQDAALVLVFGLGLLDDYAILKGLSFNRYWSFVLNPCGPLLDLSFPISRAGSTGSPCPYPDLLPDQPTLRLAVPSGYGCGEQLPGLR